MEIDFNKINGTNALLDYDILKDSIIKKMSPTCKKVEVFILNNFPVAVLAEANIDFLILLRIPNTDKSYYRILDSNKENVNVHNLIIAVSSTNEYEKSYIEINDEDVKIDDFFLDFSDIAVKLKWGLTNYLTSSCNFERNKITVHPVFWLKNESANEIGLYTIAVNELTFDVIENCILKNYYVKYPGYAGWRDNELNFEHDVKRILEQASKDSKTGYLTNNKLKRLSNKMTPASQKAFDNIGKKLVEVKGKAGTGKSSDLLKWMLQSSLKDKKALFLTYNQLLTRDISSQIKSFDNSIEEHERSFRKSIAVKTIHSFIYNLAKKLGVLSLMSKDRVNELIKTIDKRLLTIEAYIDQIRLSEPGISLAKLKMYFQNKSNFDEGEKRQALEFIKYIESNKFLKDKKEVTSWIIDFKEHKIKQLTGLQNQKIFLNDYHDVLNNIYNLINHQDKFIEDFDAINQYELLKDVLKLHKIDILSSDNSEEIDPVKLKKRFNRGIGGFKDSNKVVYIDEAQDCHPLERDIVFSLYGSNNIVIANGDKEQLIRYSQLCKWDVSRAYKIETHRYLKKAKSFRLKPAIAALANHIAESYGIELNIEPLDTEDHGAIIFNKNNFADNIEKIDQIQKLVKKGYIQDCTAYESLILLAPSNIKRLNNAPITKDNNSSKNIVVDEFNIIKEEVITKRDDWELINEADKYFTDFKIWNATGNVDKRELGIPGAMSVRAIYYESCRGLEAWSIMCFAVDQFFNQKRNEDAADNFLLNDIFDQMTVEQRKDKYAATWLLMAITRTIDTCYIEYSNLNDKLIDILEEFKIKYPHFVETTNKNIILEKKSFEDTSYLDKGIDFISKLSDEKRKLIGDILKDAKSVYELEISKNEKADKLKKIFWTNQSVKSKLLIGAFLGAISGVVIFGTGGIGIAALGTSVGVWGWLASSVGGVIVSSLYQNIEKKDK